MAKSAKNLTLSEWEEFLEEMGEKRFRGRQIFRWIYKQRIDDFNRMPNISLPLRRKLSGEAKLSCLDIVGEEVSLDGTRKFLFKTEKDDFIESVLIFDDDRVTACLSSQVGCKYGCRFCLTGRDGFKRDLDAGEIVEQFLRMEERLEKPVTNIVFMGMGEPLDNYRELVRAIRILMDENGIEFPPRRITVSTSGVIPGIQRLSREGTKVNLAVSLNAADGETRSFLMPINKKYPIEELVDAAFGLPNSRRKWVVFEYVLIKGVNDRLSDAEKLAALVGKKRAKVNLIPFNAHPDVSFQPPEPKRISEFQEILLSHNITTLVRKSKGTDINAACGQLRTFMERSR
jgi:23S rRNA (adenine2503-C2)-methyltransferase